MSLRILLPFHVRGDHLAKVVGRLMHAEFWKNALDHRGPHPIDPHAPSGPANSWVFDVTPKATFGDWPGACPSETLSLLIPGPASAPITWPFFRNSELERGQVLFPDHTALSVTLGRRICQFFGGAFLGPNSRPTWSVAPEDAQFPPILASQSEDDRWHQFQNALAALRPLSALEFQEALAEGLSPGSDREGWSADHLLPWLKERERLAAVARERELDQTLPGSSPRARGPRF